KGNRLEGLSQIGIEAEGGISKIVIPLGLRSMLTDAVTTCSIQSRTSGGSEDASTTPFGGAPSFMLSLPIAVRTEVLAVIYADDSGDVKEHPSARQRKVKFAQLVLWHAVPRLPRLLRAEQARDTLRDDAMSVLGRIQAMYESDAQAGLGGD